MYYQCNVQELNDQDIVNIKPILATRYRNLAEFNKIVSVKFDKDYSNLDSIHSINSSVKLIYKCGNDSISRILKSGPSQNDLLEIYKSSLWNKILFTLKNPTLVRYRKELEYSYSLARKKANIFGSKDVAFYLISEALLHNINTPEYAFKSTRDSQEKGYINTFNHVTAQALITSFISIETADLVSDLHERMNMIQLTNGKFTKYQLEDSINNPIDNYSDLINNEIGQLIGLELKNKFNILKNTNCTPILLSNYLNEIQSYYMRVFKIGMNKFKPSDELIIKFANKLNIIQQN